MENPCKKEIRTAFAHALKRRKKEGRRNAWMLREEKKKGG